MDKMLARINQLYPNSGYVQIRKYDASAWEGFEYDSKLENKAPLNKWKSNPLTYEEASDLADAGWRIGWIVPEGYVIVDIDNEDSPESSEVVERILNDRDVKFSYCRTSRGVHFLFKNRRKDVPSDAVTKCSLGITVDHRSNSKGYIILPINDPHRSWGDWLDEIDEIPFYLKPIVIAKNQINTFIGLSDGDGRNTELFKWRTKLLQSKKLKVEEITDSLCLINNFCFETPLDEKEMQNSVTKERATDGEQGERKEKKEKLSLTEKENVYNTLAKKITEQYDLICIGHKQYYKFEKTHYKPLRDIDVERLIHYEISENISSAGRDEMMKFLSLKTLIDPDELDKVWYKIAVGNGVIDLVTGELSAPDEDEKNTIGIPWNYNDNPQHSPRIDEFITHITSDADGTVNIMKQQFLYQIAGYCLLKKNFFGKFFIFQGEGQTGKSTFQDLIVRMIGDGNRARVGLDKMDQDYFLAMLLSKLINVDDDAVDGKILENSGRFKSLVTGNEITVRSIFKSPITFTPYATCIFNCNKLPRILDRTSGLYRRMVLIELNNKIKNPDPLFLDKLTARDMEYFLFKAVYWIGIALKEGCFRISQSEKELLRKFKCRQSSLNEWIYEQSLKLKDFYKQPILGRYNMYIDWAMTNGYKALPSVLTFKEDICTLYELEIDYSDDERKAGQQIFTKRKEPTEKELEEAPF